MKIRVLGSGAGGGFPQWNCNCRNCSGVRNGTLRAHPRTQSSIAVSGADARSWVLVNASPDILAQVRANPVLQPARTVRDTGICGILLVDAQIDHTTGLFMLRESTRVLHIWCTDNAHADLTSGNPIFTVLGHYCGVERHEMIPDGRAFSVEGVSEVSFRALAVASRPPPFSPHREKPLKGDNVALVIRDAASGRSAVYAPGLESFEEPLWREMQGAACVAEHAGKLCTIR